MDHTALKETFQDSDVLIDTSTSWSKSQLIGFRFTFLFLMLFIIIDNNGAFPFFYYIIKYPTEVMHIIIPWVGKNILSLPNEITVFTNGSGDTTYDYVLLFTMATVSVFGAIVWSVLDRKRTSYSVLLYWLSVAVRFYVGLMLINYGLIKVFKIQFPSPGLYRLTQTYGESSPMGLAWTFLGFSKGYNLFMGLAEVSAVLLLFRRTVTIGSIIAVMTTANVMAVNYFYDVPVKILSTALFVMSVFLLTRNGKPLFDFFIRNVVSRLDTSKPITLSKTWNRVAIGTKALIIFYVLVFGAYESYKAMKIYGDLAPKPTLHGLYKVRHFILGSDTIPASATDKRRWKQMSVEFEGFLRIDHVTDSVGRFFSKIDTAQRTLELNNRTDANIKFYFKYQNLTENQFQLRGAIKQDSVQIVFDRFANVESEFLLTNRGFHWVNEYPFNR